MPFLYLECAISSSLPFHLLTKFCYNCVNHNLFKKKKKDHIFIIEFDWSFELNEFNPKMSTQKQWQLESNNNLNLKKMCLGKVQEWKKS